MQLSRKQRRILAQLRTEGKCPILQSYLNLIGKASTDICKYCKLARDDVQHIVVDCITLSKLRLQNLGPQPSVEDLWSRPEAVVRMLAGGGRI